MGQQDRNTGSVVQPGRREGTRSEAPGPPHSLPVLGGEGRPGVGSLCSWGSSGLGRSGVQGRKVGAPPTCLPSIPTPSKVLSVSQQQPQTPLGWAFLRLLEPLYPDGREPEGSESCRQGSPAQRMLRQNSHSMILQSIGLKPPPGGTPPETPAGQGDNNSDPLPVCQESKP